MANNHDIRQKEQEIHDYVVAIELQERIENVIDQLPPERKKIFKMSLIITRKVSWAMLCAGLIRALVALRFRTSTISV